MTEITDIIDVTRDPADAVTSRLGVAGLQKDDVTLFRADWTEALFIHFAIPVETLRPHVPAELEIDTFNGLAYVSLVAFTQRNLRPTVGGRIGRLLATPLAEHAFLNLRTYVRHRGEPGIHFLAEWIPNRLATLIGPRTYGLPYRLARMKYRWDAQTESFSGTVVAGGNAFQFDADLTAHPITPSLGTPGEGRGGGLRAMGTAPSRTLPRSTEGGNNCPATPILDDFLLERYTAWTERAGVIRRFRIAHAPWAQHRVQVKLTDRALLDAAAPWIKECVPAFANYSAGAFNVQIGRPVRERPLTTPPRDPRLRWLAFVPLIFLPTAALVARNVLPTWMFMWLFAAGIFAGCKALTLADAKRAGIETPLFRTLGYLFVWVGMDATRWYRGVVARTQIAALRAESFRAMVNICVGLTLIFGVTHFAAPVPYLAGWVGTIGVMLILHFGLFQLLALAWQRAGIDAEPLMNRPAVAKSVGEFWSRRWNTGFNVLAERYVFRPLRRPLGPRGALLATFAASGIVHDLVISLPARAGYGLPTLYFLIHGAVVLAERKFRNARPVFTRIFTIAAVVLPAPLLAHPAFVHRVVLPMLRTIGAL